MARRNSTWAKGCGRRLAIAALAAMLAGCQSLGLGSGAPGSVAARPPTGEVIGSGATKAALFLPRSGGGNGAAIATAFRNAAELALRDFPDTGVEVHVYDTQGSPAGARAAMDLALKDGVGIVLGPVFSAEVSAAAPAARQAGVPIVAFSSDAAVAGPGVSLLSFLPADDVARIIGYAASQGRRSFAAILPGNAYGSVAEAAFRRAVAASGAQIAGIETYRPDGADLKEKAAAVAALGARIDAVFMPDAGSAPAIAASLVAAGVTSDRVKFLGSGQWDAPAIVADAALVGSWFPSPNRQGFEGFAARYQAAFGSMPPRNATLAYDATVLAAGLVRKFGPDGFRSDTIASPNGFTGLDGLFRFTPAGVAERRLAVYEVTGSGARIVAPAARSFAAGI